MSGSHASPLRIRANVTCGPRGPGCVPHSTVSEARVPTHSVTRFVFSSRAVCRVQVPEAADHLLQPATDHHIPKACDHPNCGKAHRRMGKTCWRRVESPAVLTASNAEDTSRCSWRSWRSWWSWCLALANSETELWPFRTVGPKLSEPKATFSARNRKTPKLHAFEQQ